MFALTQATVGIVLATVVGCPAGCPDGRGWVALFIASAALGGLLVSSYSPSPEQPQRAAPPPQEESRVPPFQVPRQIPHFVGRSQALAALQNALTPGRVAAICGDGSGEGLGRSTLAMHFAATHHRRFPDGVLYASLVERDPLTMLASFAAAYGADTATHPDLPSRARALRSTLARRKALIVLDDVDDGPTAREVLDSRGSECALLLTTGDESLATALTAETGISIRLGPLSEQESMILLEAIVGEEWTGTEEEASRAIIQLLGSNPLALEIAGRLAGSRGWGMAELLVWLREEQQWMEALRVHDVHVRTAMELSYKLLSERQKALFAALGTFRGSSFDASAAEAIVGIGDAPQHLASLGDLALLWEEHDGRFRQHPLLAEFALEKLQAMGQETEVLRRHAYHFATVAERASVSLQNPKIAAAARREFEVNLPQMRLGQAWVAQSAEDKVAVAYAFALGPYLDLAGLHGESVRAFNVAIQAARRLERKDWEGDLLGSLGNAHASLGDTINALGHYQQALAIHRAVANRQGEGTDLGNLGNALAGLGEIDQAIEHYEAALKISREIGDRPAEGADLGNLGSAYGKTGEMQRAVGCFEQARRIAREVDDRQGEMSYANGLGLAYLGMGESQKAIGYFEQALTIARETRDLRGQEECWANLGRAYTQLAPERSAECYQQALIVARQRGDRSQEKEHLDNLGRVFQDAQKWQNAVECYTDALKISQELGDLSAQMAGLDSLGNAYGGMGQRRQTLQCYQQALSIAQQIGDRSGEGALLGKLGLISVEMGDPRQAIRYYQQAIEITRETGEWLDEGNLLGNLGNAYADIGDPHTAIECYEQALAVHREIGNRLGEGTALGNLGLACAELGEVEKAQAQYQAALAVAEEIGDDLLVSTFSWDLGLLFVEQGRGQEGWALIERAVEIRERLHPAGAAADRQRMRALQRSSRLPGWARRLLLWLRRGRH